MGKISVALALLGYALFMTGWIMGGRNYFDGITPLVPRDSAEMKMMITGMLSLIPSVMYLLYLSFSTRKTPTV